MADREKVIKGLECCTRGDVCFSDCPYFKEVPMADGRCITAVQADALALLKEQEAIKPTTFVDKDTGETRYECSNCGYEVGYEELAVSGIVEIKHSYCPNCGKKVKWDED